MLPVLALLLSQVPQIPGYHLVWHDEFERPGKPNPKDWIYEEGFVRNRELQWYSRNNVEIRGGYLILEGRKERVPNPGYKATAAKDDWRHNRAFAEYTSGSIKTATKHTWTYGRFECRGKFGTTLGLWPAFWLTGPSHPWPSNGEIDVMEYYLMRYRANVAWGSKTPGAGIWNAKAYDIEALAHESGYMSAEDWSKEFHTYRMDWDETSIKLFVDDRLLNEVFLTDTINQSPDHANPFREPHHLLLNLAIGATGGDPNKTNWPSQFVIDYVRVYQK